MEFSIQIQELFSEFEEEKNIFTYMDIDLKIINALYKVKNKVSYIAIFLSCSVSP